MHMHMHMYVCISVFPVMIVVTTYKANEEDKHITVVTSSYIQARIEAILLFPFDGRKRAIIFSLENMATC